MSGRGDRCRAPGRGAGGVLEVGLGQARVREDVAHRLEEVERLAEWLAHARASWCAGSVSPARSIPTDCSGLFDERGKTGSAGAPHAWSRLPSDAVTATLARCTDSTNPPRTTWARTGASARTGGVGWSGAGDPIRGRRRPASRPGWRGIRPAGGAASGPAVARHPARWWRGTGPGRRTTGRASRHGRRGCHRKGDR